jgi:DNA repair exonuclease SbcCD ATPase subunit
MKGSPDKAAKKGGSSPVEASSNKETTSLSEKISALGKENRELSLKLQAAEEHAHDLFEQNKREKGKNVKAMTDMMQLKADYAESSSEVQKLKARINDVTSSLDTKEQEIAKLRDAIDSATEQAASQQESASRDNGRKKHGSSGGGGAPCPTCGSESKEVEELFAENRSLQRKMEFERSNAQQASKKQEDKIVFMTKELTTIREEMEQILRGEVGNLAVNPTFVRLLDERKKLASELDQQKEIYEIRLQSMEESISSLQQVNRDLKKQLRDNGITPDEQNIDLVTGLPMGPGGGKIEEKRDTGKKHIGEINVNFNKSIGDSKGWFAFVNK